MRVQSFEPIRRGDIFRDGKTELKEQELDRLLERVNSALDHLYTILDKRVTAEDNMAIEVLNLEVEHDVSYEVQLQNVEDPYGAVLVWWETTANPARLWRFEVLDSDLVRIRVRFESDPGEPVAVAIEIKGT